jgi:hypothetical protein
MPELGYNELIQTNRYYHDSVSEWDELTLDYYRKQQDLMKSDAIVGPEHFDIIFDDA